MLNIEAASRNLLQYIIITLFNSFISIMPKRRQVSEDDGEETLLETDDSIMTRMMIAYELWKNSSSLNVVLR